MNDPSILQRVRSETRTVTDRAQHVRIDEDEAARFARNLVESTSRTPEWDKEKQWTDGTEATAEWVFVLDSLNFCFWPEKGTSRWTVEWGGSRHRGYFALSCALKRAQEEGIPVTDPGFYGVMDESGLASILGGHSTPPLLKERAAALRENGAVLLDKWGGRFANLVRNAGGNATRLVDTLVKDFPSYRDIHTYREHPVHILKRAQILVSDLWGAFDGIGLGAFHDLDQLTAFADYRVPQILRSLNILRYSDPLAERVDSETRIPSGSEMEIEIRAATIQGVEAIARALHELGKPTCPFEIDWLLWNESHKPIHNQKPYHLTRSIWY